jgi:hypothetical protein
LKEKFGLESQLRRSSCPPSPFRWQSSIAYELLICPDWLLLTEVSVRSHTSVVVVCPEQLVAPAVGFWGTNEVMVRACCSIAHVNVRMDGSFLLLCCPFSPMRCLTYLTKAQYNDTAGVVSMFARSAYEMKGFFLYKILTGTSTSLTVQGRPWKINPKEMEN